MPGAVGGVQVGSAGKATVEQTATMGASDHTFKVQVGAKDGFLPFRGKAVQTDSKGRFVYLVWRMAELGYHRRAKVYLESIDQALLQGAVERGRPLTVVLCGRAGDGGPCCATVKPLEDWH